MSNVHKEHEYYRSLLPDVVKGTLNADEAAELDRHLADCAECAQDRSVIETAMDALQAETSPQAPPSHYFETVLPHVRERLDRSHQTSWIHSVIFTRVAVPLAALALFVVLIARVPFDSTSNNSVLRSMISSLSTEELTDAMVKQSELTLAPWSSEALSELVPENAVTTKLAADIIESGDVSAYQTLSDLSDKDIDLLLQRLGERNML